MSRGRRKNWNAVNAPSLARWIFFTGLLALTGLLYVYLKVQLYHLGDQKRALEKTLADLRVQNETASGQIATLTSRTALQHRLKEGYLKMTQIEEQSIVRLSLPRLASENAVQPVANQQRGGR